MKNSENLRLNTRGSPSTLVTAGRARRTGQDTYDVKETQLKSSRQHQKATRLRMEASMTK